MDFILTNKFNSKIHLLDMIPPLSIFKNKKSVVKKLKTETNDFKLIYY